MEHPLDILIIDDNRLRADSLAFQLEQFGFYHLYKYDDVSSCKFVNKGIVIANIGKEIPEILMQLDMPVIFLSNGNKNILQNEQRKVLIKPFHIQKLVEQINELTKLRKIEYEIFPDIFLQENLKVIHHNVDLKDVRLTDTELKIIKELISNIATGISRDNLLQTALKYNPEIDSHTIETHVYRLRKKISDIGLDIFQEQGKYQLVKI